MIHRHVLYQRVSADQCTLIRARTNAFVCVVHANVECGSGSANNNNFLPLMVGSLVVLERVENLTPKLVLPPRVWIQCDERCSCTLTLPANSGICGKPPFQPDANIKCLTWNTRVFSPSADLDTTVTSHPSAVGIALVTVEDVQTLRSNVSA